MYSVQCPLLNKHILNLLSRWVLCMLDFLSCNCTQLFVSALKCLPVQAKSWNLNHEPKGHAESNSVQGSETLHKHLVFVINIYIYFSIILSLCVCLLFYCFIGQFKLRWKKTSFWPWHESLLTVNEDVCNIIYL